MAGTRSPRPLCAGASPEELTHRAESPSTGPASLRLTALADGRLRVGVWDSHPRIPAPFGEPPRNHVPLAPLGADGGRGLRLVQEYADWGGVALGDSPLDRRAGKLLWFEVNGCTNGS